jgi:hypothetical protein
MPASRPQFEFTAEDHLRVQREIERRAHLVWLAQGGAWNSALNDWLRAEAQVLAEFVKGRQPRRALQPAAGGMQTRNGGTRPFPPPHLFRPKHLRTANEI